MIASTNQTHLLVLVGDGNASNDHRLTGLLERCHSMNIKSMADSKWQGLNLVLGLENVIIVVITFLGKELTVGDDGATGGRGSRWRKGIGVAETKAEKEGDAD